MEDFMKWLPQWSTLCHCNWRWKLKYSLWRMASFTPKNHIEVPNYEMIHGQILKSQHNSKLAGHRGKPKTFSLAKCIFTTPPIKAYIHIHINSCNSSRQVQSAPQKPFAKFDPLPIPEGPRTEISYYLIPGLQFSNGFGIILTVIDRLMTHPIPSTETMRYNHMPDPMLRHVWKLHSTPNTIVSNQGSVSVFQVTKEPN